MPLPQVVFSDDSSARERAQALRELEQGLDSAGFSAVKTQVLRAVINFAKKNLVDAGPYDFTQIIYVTCQAIFNRSSLPDLLFLQYAINRLNALRDDTSGLKKAVLPIALNYRRPLMLPLVRQMEKASFSFSLAVLFMRSPDFNLPAVAEYFSSELTAEAKIVNMLCARLLRTPPYTMKAAHVEENFGDSIEIIVGLADRAGRATLGLFNRGARASGAAKSVLWGSNNPLQPKI